MNRFPDRSFGVLFSPVADQAVAYDLVTKMVHQLSASAGAVLAACDGSNDIESTVQSWGQETGTDPQTITSGVESILAEFKELGLVDRTGEFIPPPPPAGSTSPSDGHTYTGAVHHVIDHSIVFRGDDNDLIDQIDSFLGAGTAKRANGCPQLADDDSDVIYVDITEDRSTGQITVRSDQVDRFTDRRALLKGLPTILNQYAVWSHDCITLHAGAVRSPDGDVVLLPAASGSGKSTLTATLIASAWDYLGDEAIGVRNGSLVAVGYPKPLSIKAPSWPVLGLDAASSSGGSASHIDPTVLRADVECLSGDVAPITRVVLPTYVDGAATTLERLEPAEAVVALLANTFNLSCMGQLGLHTLCGLAEQVPVDRLEYGCAQDIVDGCFGRH